MIEWTAVYRRPAAINLAGQDLESRLGVRAVDEGTARRLSADVFEQVFKVAPGKCGFELVSLERREGAIM